MNRLLTSLLTVICCVVLSSAEGEEEAPIPKLTKKDLIQLLQTKQFDELDRLAEKFAARPITLTSGYSLHRMIDFLHSPVSTMNGNTDWTQHIAQLEGWAKHSPKSVYPRIPLGGAYTAWAWSARGGEYADAVTKEGWELFSNRLDQANAVFVEADKLSSARPELYSAWLVVAYAHELPQPRIDEIFNKGRTVGRDYVNLYYTKAQFLLPRWYGKPGDWEAFAAKVADERGGSEGDLLYLQIARSQARTEGDDLFKNTKLSYPRMKKGFEFKLKSASDKVGELNSYCYYACIAGDKSTAKSLFEQIGSNWRKYYWKNEGRFQKWRNWAEGGNSGK